MYLIYYLTVCSYLALDYLYCLYFFFFFFFFFFFQAEDGIRDGRVTGVQTCALPILGHDHVVDDLPLHQRDRRGRDGRRERARQRDQHGTAVTPAVTRQPSQPPVP